MRTLSARRFERQRSALMCSRERAGLSLQRSIRPAVRSGYRLSDAVQSWGVDVGVVRPLGCIHAT